MSFISDFVPLESAEVTLGFRGEYDDITAIPVVNQITKIVQSLNGNVNDEGIRTEITTDVLYVRFSLIGSNKVDVAYRLEQMVGRAKRLVHCIKLFNFQVMQQRLPGLVADITRTRVIHKLPPQAAQLDDKPLELQQREIVSHSPVSMVAPYHTALIVIAAASAFVISVLTVLVILYRRKVSEKVCMCKSTKA